MKLKNKKIKKAKKEIIKKQIKYWLDYESPYAEYLVGKYKQWSPDPDIRVIHFYKFFRLVHQRINKDVIQDKDLRQ